MTQGQLLVQCWQQYKIFILKQMYFKFPNMMTRASVNFREGNGKLKKSFVFFQKNKELIRRRGLAGYPT